MIFWRASIDDHAPSVLRGSWIALVLAAHTFLAGGWMLLAGEPLTPWQPGYMDTVPLAPLIFASLWGASVLALCASAALPALWSACLRIVTFGGLLATNLLWAQQIATVFVLNGLLSTTRCTMPVYCALRSELALFSWFSMLWLSAGLLHGGWRLWSDRSPRVSR